MTVFVPWPDITQALPFELASATTLTMSPLADNLAGEPLSLEHATFSGHGALLVVARIGVVTPCLFQLLDRVAREPHGVEQIAFGLARIDETDLCGATPFRLELHRQHQMDVIHPELLDGARRRHPREGAA